MTEEHLSSYNKKFRIMLKMIAPPDGGEWGPTKMRKATGAQIGASYFNSLKDGAVKTPRADKIEAIAEAMGFPPQLWFKDLDWWQRAYHKWESGEDVDEVLKEEQDEDTVRRISRRLNKLVDLKPNPSTGQPFSNSEIAHFSGEVLSADRIAEIRNGGFEHVEQEELAALCDVFEVSPAYWSSQSVPWRPFKDELGELMDADSFETMQNSLMLSKDNRGMLRRLSDYLKWQQTNGG